MTARRLWSEAWGWGLKIGAAVAIAFALERRARGRPIRPTGDAPRERVPARRTSPGAAAAPGPAEVVDAEDPPDDELVRRVSARVAVPPGVEIAAVDGAVVLFGRIPRAEVETFLAHVSEVDGVTVIENRLTPIDFPDELQRA